MKAFRYFLGFMVCMGWLAGQAIADESHPKQITLPEDVKPLAPVGMSPISYSTDGVNAVMVVKTKGDYTNSQSNDPYAHPQTRLLILLRKDQGAYKEIERSDKIIACSTCGNDGIDPFVPGGIKLTKGNLFIEQDYSPEPSTAIYKFTYTSKLNHWVVVSATNIDADQNLSGGDPIRRPPQKLRLPRPPLLASFNPGWHPREPGAVVTVDNKSADFSFLHADTTRDLDYLVKKDCANKASCREIGRQLNGCIALVKNSKSAFFIGKSSKSRESSEDDSINKEAQNQAMRACESGGGNACELIRSDCT